jgi:hypothetical protein
MERDRLDDGADKKRQKRQLAALGRTLAVQMLAQILQCGDVDLLNIGYVRYTALGVLQTFRDRAAQADDLDLLDSVLAGTFRLNGRRPA